MSRTASAPASAPASGAVVRDSPSTAPPGPAEASRRLVTDTFSGWAQLCRLALRRDRWLLLIWTLGLAGMAGFSVMSTAGLYPDAVTRAAAASSLNTSTATLAMFGPLYDPNSLGELSMFKMTVFGGIAVAILASLTVIRHSRAEEETGRLELLSAAVVGRAAPLAAALTVAALLCIVVGGATSVALIAASLPVAGSLAFGAAWAATGIAFAAVAGVTAQLTASARAARQIALGAVAVAYALRALGDATDPGNSPWSWLSPLGWNKEVRAFAGDRWLVLILPLVMAAILIPLAFWLRSRRDLGQGTLTLPGKGRTFVPVTGLGSLAIRLQAGSLVVWLVFVVSFGIIMGAITATLEEWFTSPQVRDFITALGGQEVITDAVLAAYLVFMGMAAAAYGVNAAMRLRTEESAGRAELTLAGRVNRARWAGSLMVVPLLGVVVLMVAGAAAMGLSAALALNDTGQISRVLVAGIAQVPAAWVMTTLVLAVFGWWPRATLAVWAAFVVSAAASEFAALWSLPQWLANISVFYATPMLPVGVDDLSVVALLSAVAVLLAGLGLVGWQRRDLVP